MSEHWFRSTEAIDTQIREKYQAIWEEASRGELDSWAEKADASLALIIVLDQFPLNMFRGDVRAYSTEARAVDICLSGIDKQFDLTFSGKQQAFYYMPLMHSENLEHQVLSVEKYRAAGLADNLRFAEHHRDLVQRFGRFPHRNAILGRESSDQEKEYLLSDEAFHG